MQPAHPEALYILGDTCRRLHRLDEALRCFQKVLRIRPRSAETHFSQGLVFQERGELVAAESAIREATRLRPNFVAAGSSLGLVLLAQGKASGAESAFRDVLRL